MRLAHLYGPVAAVFSIAWCCAPVATAAAPAAAAQHRGSAASLPSDAQSIVHQALASEAAGNGAERLEQAQQAIAADPNFAPAHWHAGEVRVGQQWMKFADAAAAAARDGKLAEYRQLRDHTRMNTTAQLETAHWAARNGLKDQERVHLTYAMMGQPNKSQAREIAAKMQLVKRDGVWQSAQQIQAADRQIKQLDAEIRHWKPHLGQLMKDVASRDPEKRQQALGVLEHIADLSAIPGLEAIIARGNIGGAAAAAVNAIAGMPAQQATDSLVRIAVLAPDDDQRRQAAQALGKRPVFGYVPTLLAQMRSPIEVQFESYTIGGGQQHRLIMYRRGPLADQMYYSTGGTKEVVTVTKHPIRGTPDNTSVRFTPDQTLAADAERAQEAQMANMYTTANNAPIAEVLEIATGNQLGYDPQDWWNWWCDYNEVYQPPYKPVQQTVINTMPATPYQMTVRYQSCFVAGTSVETSLGPLPIEQIRPGDCVLAQDPDSGELAYKPVMATTVRPPSPLVEITAGGETIRATRGHPFWVSGVGWQMAKELKAGQRLHTPTGTVEIETAEQQGEAVCYNLIVADFNSYFVGKNRLLVHDNSLRQVTTATVPGLTQE